MSVSAPASYTLIGGTIGAKPFTCAWRTPHMPAVGSTIFLPDRDAGAHPWLPMTVLAIGHYPGRTEVAISAAEEFSTEREESVLSQALAYSATAFAQAPR